MDVTDLFENFTEIKKEQKKKLLMAHYHGKNFPIPAMGMVPHLRYMPTRQFMQRIIRRAAILDPNFTTFDKPLTVLTGTTSDMNVIPQ